MILRKYLLVTSLLIAFLLPSCTGKKNKPEPGKISISLAYGPDTLDPRYATGAYSMRIVELLFSSFVRLSPQLEIVGDAAESWRYVNKSYIFQMKPNLKFSDGTPVTAEDIIFSVKAFQAEDVPFQSAFQIIDSVKVTKGKKKNSFQVTMKLKQQSSKFINADLPVLRILPKKIVEKYGKEFNKHLVGTGPYRLKSFDNQSIVIEAVKDHPFIKVKNEQLIFKFIKDDFTRYQKMLRGEVDISLSEIPLSKIKDFEDKNNSFTIYKYPGLAMTYMLLNFKAPHIENKKLRKALASALNIDDVIKYKLNGYAIQATSILTPQNPFRNNLLTPIPYDIENAKKIIKEIGLNNHTFTLKTSNNKSTIESAKVIANSLEKIGLKVKVQSYEWGTFFGDINDGNFELALMRWVGASDPDIYRVAFHSSEFPPGRNRGRYKNAELDKLLDQAAIEMDRHKRKALFDKVQEIIHNDIAIIPLWYNQQVAIIKKEIKDFKPSLKTDYSTLVHAIKE